LAPAIEIGSEWPPKGIEPVNASEVPTANTTLLLSSGSAVTVCHHSLVDRLIDWANNGSMATIVMAVFFTLLQGMEYFGVSYTITDSVFGSTFYMGTGLMIGLIKYLGYKKLFSTYYVLNMKVNRGNNTEHISISPYWITGFADGEASFVIRIGKDKKKRLGWAVKPIFSIELHIDDLIILNKIRRFFGIGSIIIRKNRSTAIYSVQSVKNINKIIIPHFNKYVLVTQKQCDFKLFCMVIDLMNKKEHLSLEGLHKIVNIRASMNKGLTTELIKNFSTRPMGRVEKLTVNSSIKDPMWLVGFIDAEGNFYVKITEKDNKKPRISLVFSISQHSRDFLLMSQILEFLECGIIEQPKNRRETRCVIYKLEDHLKKIIPFLDEYSLQSIKLINFNYYKMIGNFINNKDIISDKELIMIKRIKACMNKRGVLI
jgi:hypothetical protein